MNRPQDIAVYGGYDSSGAVGEGEVLDKPYDTVVQQLMEAFPNLIFGYDPIMDGNAIFFKCSYSGVLEEGQYRDVGYIVSTDGSSGCQIDGYTEDAVEAVADNPFIYESENYTVTLNDAYIPMIGRSYNIVCGNGTVTKKDDDSIVIQGDVMIQYIAKPN